MTETATEFPRVYYSQIDVVPPRIVKSEAEAALLDPAQWVDGGPLPAPKEGDKPKFPAIYYNVNSPPIIINTEDEANNLGPAWRRLNLQNLELTPAKAD